MKKQLKRLIRRNLTSVSPKGSDLGIFLRRHLKHYNWRQAIGVNLAGFSFFAGIVLPQSQEALASLEVTRNTQKTVIVVETSASTYQWPLSKFDISQTFSYYHPGIDLTDPIGTPIYPIAAGRVNWVEFLPYGYGHHVLIVHEDGIKSLYAHMSDVYVKQDDQVQKNTAIGKVGITGRSTGSHLHLEIYQNDIPTNPVEVLPAIK